MSEPPLNDRELRILRGMIDEYQQRVLFEGWVRAGWRTIAKIVAVLSGAAVGIAALIEVIRMWSGH